jgi:hypothetical protein
MEPALRPGRLTRGRALGLRQRLHALGKRLVAEKDLPVQCFAPEVRIARVALRHERGKTLASASASAVARVVGRSAQQVSMRAVAV